jgi:hypothetical protein
MLWEVSRYPLLLGLLVLPTSCPSPAPLPSICDIEVMSIEII